MVTRVGFDHSTKLGMFSLSAAADVANLPLTNRAGIDEAELYEACAAGSYAYLTDGSGTKYVLDGETNAWVSEG